MVEVKKFDDFKATAIDIKMNITHIAMRSIDFLYLGFWVMMLYCFSKFCTITVILRFPYKALFFGLRMKSS